MAKTYVVPDEATIDAVIGDMLDPLLRRVEKSIKKHLPTLITVWTPNGGGPTFQLHGTSGAPGRAPAPIVGEIRLTFRRTRTAGKLTFFAEAVYSKAVSPETEFSGFHVSGSVASAAGARKVTADTWTIRYRVWEFLGWH